ncbi:MAG: DinB family protein [Dehalococcoidia bacterium]|nr:DinB family protein [Dehalococcoidia bacterium]
MAQPGSVGFSDVAVALLEAGQRSFKRATDGLPDEFLYLQPAPESNTIGWLVWHLSRWKDRTSALMSEEQQAWQTEGWAEKFGMPAEGTGIGDTPVQAAVFRAERGLLFAYAAAAHAAAMRRVARLTPEQLQQPLRYLPQMDPQPAWRLLISIAMDSIQHTGQIAYLRGLFAGYGWAR